MRFLKYLLVGSSATALHYAVLIVCVEALHGPAMLGAAVGAFVGAIWAYAGNRRYTFADRPAAHAQALPRFLAVAALMAIGHGLVVGCGQAFGLHYLIAQVAASAAALGAGYGLNKRWSFAA
ncbi:GtrA family protein [Burkholderiaceae bacterium UC74_6]